MGSGQVDARDSASAFFVMVYAAGTVRCDDYLSDNKSTQQVQSSLIQQSSNELIFPEGSRNHCLRKWFRNLFNRSSSHLTLSVHPERPSYQSYTWEQPLAITHRQLMESFACPCLWLSWHGEGDRLLRKRICLRPKCLLVLRCHLV
jgi:hypothetical protein